ncbi:MAG: SGNH/GDSL hydrolase family protein [Kiritimatiellae bacterium]|nr:SGNH/GDSL hydrolase family protein [Kiritimatiellia bacterium]
MKSIEEIDSNFKVATVDDREINYYNVLSEPFSVEGFPWGSLAEGKFNRLPDFLKIDEDINSGAYWSGHSITSGGCARFRTDATFICIRTKINTLLEMNHMPRTGANGFDLYVGKFGEDCHHISTVRPTLSQTDIEQVIFNNTTWTNEVRDWCINFPLYGGVTELEIGLPPGSKIEAPTPHAIKPILFYGSSITQGGCASRPGNNYCSMLCRDVNAEQINLGFSGCGKGEPAVARAIAKLDLGVFVMDYDHNAKDIDDLRATHEPFYKIIREAHPNLPIIMISMCDIWKDRDYETKCKRRDLIRENYEKAIAAGDKHVYFIDGEILFGTANRDACTVDGCHPNDLGFYRMYENILPVLRQAIREA